MRNTTLWIIGGLMVLNIFQLYQIINLRSTYYNLQKEAKDNCHNAHSAHYNMDGHLMQLENRSNGVTINGSVNLQSVSGNSALLNDIIQNRR